MSSAPASALHRSCADTLRGWLPPSPEQHQLREDYGDHLHRHPDGWSRSCPGSHLTASAMICAVAERQVLLTLHAKIGRWLQTGGHIEAADASLEEAALREATEESGLDALQLHPQPLLLSRHELSCRESRTFHLDVQFLVTVPSVRAPRFGTESLDVRWFPPDRLPGVDESVRDLVAAAGSRLGWPEP